MIINRFCLNRHDTFIYGRAKSGICKKCTSISNKKWRDGHRAEIAIIHKKYSKKYYKNHSIYLEKRKMEDPNFKLLCNLRIRLKRAIKNNQKVGSAVRDLGCSIEFFKNYIQDKFYTNMSWDNYGSVWEIDHIIPLCKFDLLNRDQLLKAVHYTNLQPLTIEDHKKKTVQELRR